MVEPKDLWREVVKLHELKGFTRADAFKAVIIEWLLKGETEPLIEAIRTGELTDPVLSVIALMLLRDEGLEYCLTVEPLRIGAPKKPGLLWRDWFIEMAFEKRCEEIGSAKAFEEIADKFGISVSTIRRAVGSIRGIRKTLQAIDPPTTNKS